MAVYLIERKSRRPGPAVTDKNYLENLIKIMKEELGLSEVSYSNEGKIKSIVDSNGQAKIIDEDIMHRYGIVESGKELFFALPVGDQVAFPMKKEYPVNSYPVKALAILFNKPIGNFRDNLSKPVIKAVSESYSPSLNPISGVMITDEVMSQYPAAFAMKVEDVFSSADPTSSAASRYLITYK